MLPSADGWVNVDLAYLPVLPGYDAVSYVDLDRPWPWGDSTVDEIRSWDLAEHLKSKIHFMNEAWRVLVPGGILDLFVPTTDGRGAFQDPGHRVWYTPNDLFYFCEGYAEWVRFRASYGIRAHFRVVSQSHDEYPDKVWKLKAVLEAVK